MLVLLLVLEFDGQQIEQEHEHEHDYEVAMRSGLPSVAARERRLRRVDLLTWSRIGGAKSANEVAQIINQKNNSLKEGSRPA